MEVRRRLQTATKCMFKCNQVICLIRKRAVKERFLVVPDKIQGSVSLSVKMYFQICILLKSRPYSFYLPVEYSYLCLKRFCSSNWRRRTDRSVLGSFGRRRTTRSASVFRNEPGLECMTKGKPSSPETQTKA